MKKQSLFRKEALERLSSPEQLDQLMAIVTPRSWLPLGVLSGLVGCALLWSIFGRIPVTTSGRGTLVYADTGQVIDPSANVSGQQLVGVAYFSAGEVAQIEPGMKVLLIPDVEGAQVAGGLMGTVQSISEPTINTLDAARSSQNSSESGRADSLVEVIAQPEQNQQGDYIWSTGANSMSPIAGMPAIARVTLTQQAPITFVFPFLANHE